MWTVAAGLNRAGMCQEADAQAEQARVGTVGGTGLVKKDDNIGMPERKTPCPVHRHIISHAPCCPLKLLHVEAPTHAHWACTEVRVLTCTDAGELRASANMLYPPPAPDAKLTCTTAQQLPPSLAVLHLRDRRRRGRSRVPGQPLPRGTTAAGRAGCVSCTHSQPAGMSMARRARARCG